MWSRNSGSYRSSEAGAIWRGRAAFVAVLMLVATFSSAWCPTAASQDVSERPNILWIIAEDLSPDLGIYGTPEARTPNIDRLARRGMHFTSVFAPSPVCSSSRSALMTGMYPVAIGANNHRSHREDTPSPHPWPLPEGVRVVSDWLRQAGYFTGNIVTFPDDVTVAGEPVRGSGKTDWNFTYDGEPFDTDRWADLKTNQPFYAQINFSETHRGHAWQSAQEIVEHPADPARVRIPPYYPDHPVVRREWAEYLNTLQVLDAKVGAVLGRLEREGLADNTVVVFLSDHGRAMVRGKQWPYDSGLHVPLIIDWPENFAAPPQYRSGTESDQLLSTLDLTTTTLGIAGVPRPEEKTQGHIFLGASAGPERQVVFGGRDRGDETVDRIRTVRSRRYRYIRNYFPERPFLQHNGYKMANYPTIWILRRLHREGKLTPAQARLTAPIRPHEELYDLEADPYEIDNLADSPEHREVLMQLRGKLDAWLQENDDMERKPEDPAVLTYYYDRMEGLWKDQIEQARAAFSVQVGYTSPLYEVSEAEAAGFDYLELRTSELAELTEEEFEKAIERVAKLSIPAPVSNYFVPSSVKLTGPNVDKDQQTEYVRRALDRVSRLGVELVVFGSGGARSYPDGFDRQRAFAQLVDFGKRIAPEAQRRGIKILVEPLRRQESNIINTAREGLELVRAVNHANFQLMVDFYHLAVEQEDPDIIREAADYIHHLHVANPDGRVFPRSWDEYRYAPFFEALREIRYDKRISVEAHTDDLLDEGPEAIRLMRDGFDPSISLR